MPGVSVAGDATMRAVAASGLRGATAELPADPLEGYAWERLLAGVRAQRMQGLLAQAVIDGRLPVTDEQRREVAELHGDAMFRVLGVERAMLDAVEILSSAGVDATVLKGSAAAHLDYPDPALRVFGDVDLLLAGGTLPDATAAFAAAGYRRPRPELSRGFDRRFGKSIDLVGPHDVQIDLHRTLALEPFGLLIDTSDLFEGREGFTVGDTKLQALSVTCRFVHACYHAVLGNHPVRLVPLRDAAGIALSGRLDRDAAIALAERWQGGAVVARAVGLAWRAFGLDPDDPLSRWATDRPETHGEHELLTPFGPEQRRQTHRTLATVRLLHGLRAKAAYLRAVLLPGGRYLRSRGLSRLGWLKRGRAALRHQPSPGR
jgi:hypothetical protein